MKTNRFKASAIALAAILYCLPPANAITPKTPAATPTKQAITGKLSRACEWWPGEGIFCCSGNRCGFLGDPDFPNQ